MTGERNGRRPPTATTGEGTRSTTSAALPASGSAGFGILRPDHLLVWLTGPVADPPVVDDERLDVGFDLMAWFEELRPGYPDAVLGAVYSGSASSRNGYRAGVGDDPPGWRQLAECAAKLHLSDESRVFTGDTTPTSLGALRRWVASQLGDDHPCVDDVILVVSELATNVERHADSWLTVDLVELPGTALVAVTDPTANALPLPRVVPAEHTSGRGLLVVTALTEWWGVVVRPKSKTVWAAIPTPAGSTDAEPSS